METGTLELPSHCLRGLLYSDIKLEPYYLTFQY